MDRVAVVPLPPLDEHSLLVFWCQILVVLVAARLGGYAMRRIGQPRVIGELLGGVVIGPSPTPSGSRWSLGRLWQVSPSGELAYDMGKVSNPLKRSQTGSSLQCSS